MANATRCLALVLSTLLFGVASGSGPRELTLTDRVEAQAAIERVYHSHRIDAGRPLLAVCLGLQLLAEGSEEAPGRRGLGAIAGIARRFPATVRVPQLGWNVVTPDEAFDAAPRGAAYFANSFRLVDEPGDGWNVARAEYGGRFIAAVQRGAVLACQFHRRRHPWRATACRSGCRR